MLVFLSFCAFIILLIICSRFLRFYVTVEIENVHSLLGGVVVLSASEDNPLFGIY